MDGPHKRDTFQRFDRLKMLEHDLALSSEKKSQNKTSQASQKPAKTFLSFIIINISPFLYHLGGSVGRVQDAKFAAKCGRGFESYLRSFWKIFFHH